MITTIDSDFMKNCYPNDRRKLKFVLILLTINIDSIVFIIRNISHKTIVNNYENNSELNSQEFRFE